MKPKPRPRNLNRTEYRAFIGVVSAAGIILFASLITNIFKETLPEDVRNRLLFIAGGGIFYIIIFSSVMASVREQKDSLIWLNAIVGGVGLLTLSLNLPPAWGAYYRLIAVLMATSAAVLSERPPLITALAIGTLPPAIIRFGEATNFVQHVEALSVPVITLLISETLLRVQNVARRQIHRLETINAFSRQLASTLNRTEILALLNSAIPKAVTADTFYVGIVEGEELYVPLFFDDGEYFNEMHVPLAGTLSSWVVENQRELFLPNLRAPLGLPGVGVVVAGKDRASLSWIGAPMITNRFKGLISLGSYQANAFNRGDLELLANLAQHVTLAIENALIHEEVESKSQLDQMTGVLNHGAFLKRLRELTDASLAQARPLSLVMLDVDYFKQYNDTYGHLVGDKVLNSLCDTMRSHIKSTDAIGRWGGEEFIIALPNATGDQAHHVAERIRKTMSEVPITGRVGEPVPAPTVSQGIAEFPLERKQMYDLIDLADQRLYLAKERGRNQIEPNELFLESR